MKCHPHSGRLLRVILLIVLVIVSISLLLHFCILLVVRWSLHLTHLHLAGLGLTRLGLLNLPRESLVAVPVRISVLGLGLVLKGRGLLLLFVLFLLATVITVVSDKGVIIP